MYLVDTNGSVVPHSVVGDDGWEVPIEREVNSAEFECAVVWVSTHLPFMITKPLTAIRLVQMSDVTAGAVGLFNNKWGERYAAIDITVEGHYGVGDYINTLVHELTHLKQHVEGRLRKMSHTAMEAEAEEAGKLAERQWRETND